MSAPPIVLATRKSALARAQTDLAAARLRERLPDLQVEILPLQTTGDQQADWSLEKEGGKGLFTAELEKALLDGRADLAVHSAKDLPTEMRPELVLAGFLPRADPRDVLVLREECASPRRIASGSPRRRAQGRRLFPEAEWIEIRGSVETRLRKIAEGEADATLLAAAGLARLDISSFPGLIFRPIPLEEMIPAVGQAAIALQCRAEDAGRWEPHLDADTARAVFREREFLRRLGGGCMTAAAAHCAGGEFRAFHQENGFRRAEVTVEENESEEKLKERVFAALNAHA